MIICMTVIGLIVLIIIINIVLFKLYGYRWQRNRWINFIWKPYYAHGDARRRFLFNTRHGLLKEVEKGFLERRSLQILICFPFVSLFNTLLRWFLLIIFGVLLILNRLLGGRLKCTVERIENDNYWQTDLSEILLLIILVLLHVWVYFQRTDSILSIPEILAGWRLWGLLTYAPAMIFFVHYRIYRDPLSIMRSLILLFVDLLQIILCFSILYLSKPVIEISECGNIVSHPFQSIYFSFVTITTLGYGDLRPVSAYGRFLVCFEAFFGLVFVLLIFGSFLQRAWAKSRA